MQANVLDFARELGLESCIARATTFHPGKLHLGVVWNVPVEYNDRLQTTAGLCHYQPTVRLELNCSLRLPNQRVHLIETFLHELAHAHAFMVYGCRGHGNEWWKMMHQLGQIPRRTHNIAACHKSGTTATKTLDDMGL